MTIRTAINVKSVGSCLRSITRIMLRPRKAYDERHMKTGPAVSDEATLHDYRRSKECSCFRRRSLMEDNNWIYQYKHKRMVKYFKRTGILAWIICGRQRQRISVRRPVPFSNVHQGLRPAFNYRGSRERTDGGSDRGCSC